VGSVAKETWLSGSADIDIFINFPIDLPMKDLKEKGLKLAYQCSEGLNGISEEHYASHPYITSYINGYHVDIVPCYDISDSSQLRSAVDRTILHTNYMVSKLKSSQKDEVLLLKKFMKEVGVYGSEFKVGGFAGYLCEILILKYGTFENTLKKVSDWVQGTVIDLENHQTSYLFDDDLIAIDPTDKNRNVGAALILDKMVEFIVSSRNFINDPKIDYFYPLKRQIPNVEYLINSFKDRQSQSLSLIFNIPNISVDNLYPQIKKTANSLKEKLENHGFTVINGSYWSDEKKIAIILLELDTWTLSKYETHFGPKIWNKKASEDFISIHGDKCYLKDDFWALKRQRKNKTAKEFIRFTLKENNINILKIGKNLKDMILDSYELITIEELLNDSKYYEDNSFLSFLEDYLNPGKLLIR
jgi:tRNA nucleotidyltransferase (CCA-adding enzyme)